MENSENTLKNTKTSDDEIKRKKVQRAQRITAITVCALILAAFVFCYIKFGKQLYEIFCNAESLRAFLSRFKGYDRLAFVCVRAFQTVVKIIPAEPLEIGSGVLYGTWGGLLYCMIGTELGSLVIILLTKAFGRRIVNLFVPMEKIESMKFLQDKKKVYATLFFIYLIPGTPKDVLTYVAALVNLNIPKFLLITGIARIPSIITSTLCGENIINKNYTLAIAIFAVTGLLGIGGSIIYKYITDKREKSVAQENIEEHGDNAD